MSRLCEYTRSYYIVSVYGKRKRSFLLLCSSIFATEIFLSELFAGMLLIMYTEFLKFCYNITDNEKYRKIDYYRYC